LQNKSYLKCISHKCGKEYPIPTTEFKCVCGNPLDVKYSDVPRGLHAARLKKLFYQR